MKPNDPSITSISEIKHRLLVPVQTKGSLGKSTLLIAVGEWLTQLKLPEPMKLEWQGYDLDSFNRSLSRVYPEEVTAVTMSGEPKGDMIGILRTVAQKEVTIIDPSAHMNKIILSALEEIQFPELAAKSQVRVSVILFPVDEVSDMDDISETVDALKDRVDYVIVRNPARNSTTQFFHKSELEKELQGYGAAYLEMPALLSKTRNYLRGHEVMLKRGISPAEAVKNPELRMDAIHRMVLERWIGDLFQGFNAIAAHLLPDAAAQSIRPAKADAMKVGRKATGINLENIL